MYLACGEKNWPRGKTVHHNQPIIPENFLGSADNSDQLFNFIRFKVVQFKFLITDLKQFKRANLGSKDMRPKWREGVVKQASQMSQDMKSDRREGEVKQARIMSQDMRPARKGTVK